MKKHKFRKGLVELYGEQVIVKGTVKRYTPENQYLLSNVEIEIENDDFTIVVDHLWVSGLNKYSVKRKDTIVFDGIIEGYQRKDGQWNLGVKLADDPFVETI